MRSPSNVVGAILLMLLGLATDRAAAQSAIVLRGTAYDSLRNQPLVGAFVTIRGVARAATSDSVGHFTFDSLAPGAYVLTLQHDALDSIGLSGITRRVDVSATTSEIVLAVPSFATMWRATCQGSAPTDSGLVYGTIRDASSRNAVPSANVVLTWINLTASNSITDIRQRRWRFEAVSDSVGSFAFCGVPTNESLQLNARAESQASGLLNLRPGRLRIHRVDLFVGNTAGAAARGTIVGKVTRDGGAPIRDARVVMDELPEVRSNAQGDFVIRNVPAGTQQVEALALGMLPFVTLVDVVAGDTIAVDARLQKVATLEGVTVTAETPRTRVVAGFEERRNLGIGKFQDSTWISPHGTMASVFQEFLGVTLQRTTGSQYMILLPTATASKCLATLYIDRLRVRDHAEVGLLRPEDIAGVEVYSRWYTTPTEFQDTGARCGSVVIWTKRAFP